MKRNKIFIYILIFWSLSPMLWQLYSSFTSPEALIEPFTNLNNRWTLENYKLIFSTNPPFWRYLLNSTFVGLLTTLLTLILSVPSSYILSRANKTVEKVTRTYLLAAALFPYVLLFLALLELARAFNLANNILALCIPYSALSLPLSILLLTSSFKQIPKEIEEASIIDGLNFFQRLRWILVPLITPAIASTSILVFLFSWNEYPIALTWISNTELLTLPVAIARIAGSSVYSVPYGAFAAATVIGSIPLLLIVMIFQKQIVSGLTQGAVKG